MMLQRKSTLMPLDDPEVYDGAPVGIQIVGRKFEEEKIWAIGKIVHDLVDWKLLRS
jgi:Asp-tRNA(Asn)/Glu-tRNA(Gln) amidotransferase A subunit family amidase